MTTHLEDALRDVLARPDDDDPRLEYAECCASIGDAARARFIRLEVDDARRARAGLESATREAAEAGRLGCQFGSAWAGSLGSRVRAFHFYRGFVEHIEIDAATFLATALELYAIAPIRRLTLREPALVLAELCGSPHLDRIVSLDLQSFKSAFDDDGLRQIYSSPHMQRLRNLGLGGNLITEAGVEALAASGALPNLRKLELRGTPAKSLMEEVDDDAGFIIDARGSPARPRSTRSTGARRGCIRSRTTTIERSHSRPCDRWALPISRLARSNTVRRDHCRMARKNRPASCGRRETGCPGTDQPGRALARGPCSPLSGKGK